MPITETRPRTALLGGTFDPVHIGHVHLFHEASENGIGRLIVIPASLSNFKRSSHPASFSDRIEMLRLAVEDYRTLYPQDCMEIIISSFEGERGGVSYTSETINAFFEEAEDDGKVNFIIGDDIIPTLGHWHDFSYLRTHVRFLCFTRLGSVHDDSGAEVIFIRSEAVHASSSEVRAGDLSMLSSRVREYVYENRLYGTGS